MRPAADQRLIKKAQAQNWVMTGELEVLLFHCLVLNKQ